MKPARRPYYTKLRKEDHFWFEEPKGFWYHVAAKEYLEDCPIDEYGMVVGDEENPTILPITEKEMYYFALKEWKAPRIIQYLIEKEQAIGDAIIENWVEVLKCSS